MLARVSCEPCLAKTLRPPPSLLVSHSIHMLNRAFVTVNSNCDNIVTILLAAPEKKTGSPSLYSSRGLVNAK